MTSVESYSLDGVVIQNRNPFSLEAVKNHFRDDPREFRPPPIAPVVWNQNPSAHMSVKEALAFPTKIGGYVELDTWEYLCNRKAVIVGNTGRPYARAWVNMTTETLRRGNVYDLFHHIHYRPDGLMGIQSKGAVLLELLKEYSHVSHFDIDPYVVFGLAHIFPQADFYLVQGLHAGILMTSDEKVSFPNVYRIGQLQFVEREDDFFEPIHRQPADVTYFEVGQRLKA